MFHTKQYGESESSSFLKAIFKLQYSYTVLYSVH